MTAVVAGKPCGSISPKGLVCTRKPGHESIHEAHGAMRRVTWTSVARKRRGRTHRQAYNRMTVHIRRHANGELTADELLACSRANDAALARGGVR